MFALMELFTGTKAVVSLVPPMLKVVETLKKQRKDPTLERVIQQVRIDALESAQGLKSELIAVLHDFHGMQVSLRIPLSRAGDDLSWLTDPVKKHRIQQRRDKINEIHRSLTSATDHLGSVLACMQRTEGLGECYAVASEIRRELDQLALREPSMGESLESYLRLIDDYIAQLQ